MTTKNRMRMTEKVETPSPHPTKRYEVMEVCLYILRSTLLFFIKRDSLVLKLCQQISNQFLPLESQTILCCIMAEKPFSFNYKPIIEQSIILMWIITWNKHIRSVIITSRAGEGPRESSHWAAAVVMGEWGEGDAATRALNGLRETSQCLENALENV